MSGPFLRVNEIFHSIQGESTYAGLACVFVRLTGCNLRCLYCDTAYAFYEGEWLAEAEILSRVLAYDCRLVELTGGEPLLQKGTPHLAKRLLDLGFTVLMETSGAQDISVLDPRVIKIMDLKCPESGEMASNRLENLIHLTPQDELKFVIGNRRDYEWASAVILEHRLVERCKILFSPVFGRLQNDALAGWILQDRFPVRMQIQMHKYIWDPALRGV